MSYYYYCAGVLLTIFAVVVREAPSGMSPLLCAVEWSKCDGLTWKLGTK
jgi:hypothetical protein